MNVKENQTILVTFLMQLGDLILTTPFLTVLRKSYPHAKIVFLIDKKWLPIVEHNSDIDEVITIDRKGKDKGIKALFAFTRKLKKRKFDYVININPSERCSFLAAFSGAEYKVGASASLFKYFFDKHIPLNRNLHAADMYIAVLRKLGIKDLTNDGLKITSDKTNETNATTSLKHLGIDETDKIIGFNIGSASETKRWMPERFAKVADKLSEKGYKILFLGSQDELLMVENTVNMMNSIPLIATGKLTLGELVCVIKRLTLLITNDSGPMHIAVSQKTPIVALYGPSKASLYGPYKAENAVVVKAKPPCPDCEDRMKHTCDKMICMKNITVDQVFEASKNLLEKE